MAIIGAISNAQTISRNLGLSFSALFWGSPKLYSRHFCEICYKKKTKIS